MALVFLVWYPAPLHRALGVTSIFLLLLLVDVTLGPLLTFVVFKKGKRTLLLDLAVIAALQLSALMYGLYVIAEGRPGWMVFGGYHFELVRQSDMQPGTDRPQAPWLGPQWVSVPPANALDKILAINTGMDIYYRPDRYQPLEAEGARLAANARALSELEKDPAALAELQKRWPDADGWLPLQGRELNMVVLVNRANARAVGVADLRPW